MTAILAGGCFWCTEAIFSRLEGVESVVPGYAGVSADVPNYDRVSSGTTPFAEAIKITYDPELIRYETLLEVFFATHDPTTLDRQGADVGHQYRSAIFPTTPEQAVIARTMIDTLTKGGRFSAPIVTTIEEGAVFSVAEDYHHHYFERMGESQAYCRLVISPKIQKLEHTFSALVKTAET